MKQKWKQLKANEERIQKKRDSFEFEKGDGLALFVAALITFLPALLLVIGLLVLIIWLIFG